ncbi:MAG: glycosyltransferase [Bacteroidota bacterium]
MATQKRIRLYDSLLVECAWEICNQVGGIYTVIRSKVPAIIEKWGDNYCLLGPDVNPNIKAEFDPIIEGDDPIFRTVAQMREMGYEVKYGRWLVTGRPKTVLLNPENVSNRLQNLQNHYSNNHGIAILEDHDLLNQMIRWADLNRTFFKILSEEVAKDERNLVAHFHEWMSGLPILDIKSENIKCKTVFTTHATMLGRYLAMNETTFYSDIKDYDWKAEAIKYNVLPLVQIERSVAKAADKFTTVSPVTGLECINLLGRKPDVITPNGLNIQRFTAYHEVQNLHQKFKEEIHDFTIGHFFHHTDFNLDNTLYFFTSGRYEYKNKGFDITLDALKKLNERMKKEKCDVTVIMFFITKRQTWSINPDVLESRGVLEEIRTTCEEIQKEIGHRLFLKAASLSDEYRLPDLNELVDDYWKLRFRRTIQSWKTDQWPIVVTHNLMDDLDDDILKYLRGNKMVNDPSDKVKIVYHPDFINPTNPLFGIDYTEFVRGCHLGIFPSYYEPWGYTPLESIASGVPTVTSDLSGFGKYADTIEKELPSKGVYLLKREGRKYERQVNDLTSFLYDFVMIERRERIIMRNRAEDFAEKFDWRVLRSAYEKAYRAALKTPYDKPETKKSEKQGIVG